MSLPQTKARFASKKPCSKCNAEWKANDTIYKINEEYWCSNPHCPKQAEGSRQAPESTGEQEQPATNRGEPTEFYKKTSISIKLVDYHQDVWGFSVEEATKVYPSEFVKVPGDTDKMRDLNLKDRMILAQVYYKALMGLRE